MINITRTSEFAARPLADANSLRVHSVYEKTINLMTPTGQLLALQAKGSPLSPISLITDMPPAEIKRLRGKPLIYMNSALSEVTELSFSTGSTLPVAIIDIKKAEIMDLSLHSLPNTPNPIINNITTKESSNYHTHCQEILTAAKNIIAESDTNGFENIIKNTPAAIAKRNSSLILTAAYKKLAAINKENIPELLPGFIGLGTGLTPSGDDFICGALAALQLLEILQHREKFKNFYSNAPTHNISNLDATISNISSLTANIEHTIMRNIQNTNTISQAFLKCALQRQYGEAIIQLFTNPTNIPHHSKAFHSIGHSSGIDSICGIYFIFNIFLIRR